MRPLPSLIAVAAIVLAAGCATRASGSAAYEQALAQWQGASEDLLRSRWGKPAAEERVDHGTWLVYVTNNGAVPGPTVSLSIGGFGFGGGRVGMGGGVGVTTPVGPPTALTCTTRFLVEDRKVTTWNFDGPGCGAGG